MVEGSKRIMEGCEKESNWIGRKQQEIWRKKVEESESTQSNSYEISEHRLKATKLLEKRDL